MPSKKIEKIVTLLHKQINSTVLSGAEKRELTRWKSRSRHNLNLYSQIVYNPETIKQEVSGIISKKDRRTLWKKIKRQISHETNTIIFYEKNIYSNNKKIQSI
jgi:hypothetical protein